MSRATQDVLKLSGHPATAGEERIRLTAIHPQIKGAARESMPEVALVQWMWDDPGLYSARDKLGRISGCNCLKVANAGLGAGMVEGMYSENQ